MARHRLFFALAPPPAVRGQLARAADAAMRGAQASSRRVAEEMLHVTLAFLGDFDGDEAVARARAAAARTHGEPFQWEIDQAASFGPTWFLGSAAPPAALAALQAALSAELATEGFALEQRAFHPHLTFLRRAGAALPVRTIAPIAWRVAEFVLYDSHPTERRYDAIGSWPL